MYIREIKRTRKKDGSTVRYLQIARSVWNPSQKRCETQILYNVGRVDDPQTEKELRGLAQKILERFPPEEPTVCEHPGFRFVEAWDYGGIYVLECLWERWGIQQILHRQLEQEGVSVLLEQAIFAMVANRCLASSSKLYCYDRWLSHQVYFPQAEELHLHHLYRALDFLQAHKARLEERIFFTVADRFACDVDLIFYDTTSVWFEIEEEDGEDAQGNIGLRRRGYSHDHRGDCPQMVVGLAVTRDGLPVRSWVFPGNRPDVSTVEKVKADLRGWKLNRCVFVGDSGMVSAENLQALSRGGGKYIVGMPLRREEEITREVLTRPGRYHQVADNLKVKEVWVPGPDAGERRRRYVVGYNPQEAAKDRTRRGRILEELEVEVECLKSGANPHPKAVCGLLSSRRYGPYLRRLKSGGVRIDRARVRAEERLDGKFVVTSNDDTLTAEDLALAYKQLIRVEGAWRALKSGLWIRPVFHWTPHRIEAHVMLCVLALLMEVTIERLCGDTWRNVYDVLRRIKVAQFLTPHGRVFQTSQILPEAHKVLSQLEVDDPPEILNVTHIP